MQREILEAIKSSFSLEASCSEFAEAYIIAKQWSQSKADAESSLWFATTAMLCGKLTEAEIEVDKVIENQIIEEQTKEIATFLKECLLCDRYERMPGEISTPFADVQVARASNGYYWATKSLLPVTSGKWKELGILLNQHHKERDWRVFRNLLAGNPAWDNNLAQDINSASLPHQYGYCSAEAARGEIVPALALVSFFYWGGNPAGAVKYLEEAYAIAEKENSSQKKAECLIFEADRLSAPYSSPVILNFAMQTPHYNLSNNLLPVVENMEFQIPSAVDLAKAERKYEQAENLFRKVGSSRGLGHISLRFGYLAFIAGDYKSALAHLLKAGIRFSESGDFCFSNLVKAYSAILLTLSRQFGEALENITEIANWGRENGQCSWTNGLGHIIGRVARHFLFKKSDIENALNLYKLAREFQIKLGNTFAAAQYNIEMAGLYERIGHYIQATNLYLEGLREMNYFFEKTAPLHTDTYGRSMALLEMCNIGYSGVNLGIQKINPVFIDQWLSIAQGANKELINSIYYDDSVRLALDDHLKNKYEALQVNGMIISLIYQGKIARENGNLATYQESIVKAEQLWAASKLPKEMSKLLEINIAVAKDDWEKAQRLHKEYIILELEKSLAQSLDLDFNNLAGQFLQKDLDFQLINRIFSLLVRTRLYKEALVWYEKLNDQHGPHWWMNEKFPWLEIANVAEMWEGLGEINLALEHYDMALELFEKYRSSLSRDELKMALSDMQNMVYTLGYAVRSAFKANQPERALMYAEGAKSRALLDLMQENRFYGNVEPGFSAALFQLREKDAIRTSIQYQILRRTFFKQGVDELEELQDKLATIGGEIALSEENLQRNFPEFFKKKETITKPFNIQTLLKQIEEDTLLLSYFYAGDELFMWAIDQKGLLDASMFQVKDWYIKSRVYLLRKSIANKSQDWQSYAEELASLLLSPVALHINKYQRLIFVLHGALQGMPVHILPFGDNNKPIGLDYTISYLPAAAALPFVGRGEIVFPVKALIVGNPTLDLKGAELESSYLSSLFPESNEMLFLRDKATGQNIMQSISFARLLHFATHGNISEDNPMASSLSLANGEKLSVQDLMGVELSAELVVLSACNSGKGNQTAGDDLLGLARALIAGGAHAAVLTYWPVDDLATSLWVRHFYLELKRGVPAAAAAKAAQVYVYGLSEEALEEELKQMWGVLDPGNTYRTPNKSLRATVRDIGFTKAETPRDYQHPYYWGAFSVLSR